MLTLMLLRHAKAGAHGLGDDFDRELTSKGVDDAAALGRHLAEIGILPDVALVSSAERTRQTFDAFHTACGRAITARFEPSLYNATDAQLRDILRYVDNAVGTLMVVGHNPGIMDAAALLARDGDVNELMRLRSRFPPCALAVLTFHTDSWADARASGGRLDLLLLPEDLAPPA